MKLRFVSPVYVIAWILSLPLPLAAQSTTQATAVPRQLTIRFEGGLAAANFAEVISALGAQERLPVVAYLDRDGLTPAEIMAKTGRLVGGTVAPVLDAYLCSLNRHVCEPPAGAAPKRGRWKNVKAPADTPPLNQTCFDDNLPPHVLCLPDIRVNSYFTTAAFSYDPSKEKLYDLVVTRSGACVKLDDRCERLIKDLNRAPIESDQRPRTLRLPVRGHRVTLPIADARQLEHMARTLDRVIETLKAAGGLATEQINIYYTVTSPGLKAQRHATTLADIDTDPIGTYLQPLDVMKYPYRTAKDFAREKLARVVVGIWDRHVDADHCDYVAFDGKAIALSEPLELDPARDPPLPTTNAGCDNARAVLEQRWDHGTGVAGLVGARFNGHGIVGANPSAFLWTYEMDEGSRLEKDDDPLFRIVSSSPIKAPVVINISLAEPAGRYQSPLQPFIKKTPDVLWVAAAGNDGMQITATDDCRIIPACLSITNNFVISVVALKSDGTDRLDADPKGSNWGTAFDVGAVGAAVSTLHGNSFGPMVGTSVAAPYVTGLASLIFAKSRLALKPREVKERILYTADFSDELDVVVRFGRINFTRALRFEDRQEFKREFCPASGCEATRAVKRGVEQITVAEGVRDGNDVIKDLDLSVRDIRRIAAKDDPERYWIVYVDGGGVLHKIQDAKFKGASVLKFKDGLVPTSVPIVTLKDYTCALSCN